MPFMNAGKHIMLDALAAVTDEVSLHNDDPSTTGANELTGGSYARLAPAFAASSGGEKALSAELQFDVPAASTVAWVGFWAASVFVAKAQLAAPEVYAGAGTYTLNTSTKLDINDPA